MALLQGRGGKSRAGGFREPQYDLPVAKEYGANRAAEAEQLASRTAWARSSADWGWHRAAWSEFLPRARPAWQEMLPQQGPRAPVQELLPEEGPRPAGSEMLLLQQQRKAPQRLLLLARPGRAEEE